MPETNARMKVCHDTAANFKTNNPTLLVGEWALETDTKKMKIGDGTKAYNSLPYSTVEESEEWQKPSDWVDMRNGALDNSIYMLVAHSTPTESEGAYTVATYPTFTLTASVSTAANTYDVYVDGIKVATTASGTATTLNWGTLYTAGTIAGGFNVTYPTNLVTHVIRLTPSVGTDTLSAFDLSTHLSSGTDAPVGLLWVHFNISNAISLRSAFSARLSWEIFEAVTAVNDEIKVTDLYHCWGFAGHLKYVPWLNGEGRSISGYRVLRNNDALKRLKLKNITLTGTQKVQYNSALEVIDYDNVKFACTATSFQGNDKLKNIVPFVPTTATSTDASTAIAGSISLTNTCLDISNVTNLESFGAYGTEANRLDGLKGLVVSNSAPFDGTSPQINVSYTGLNRGTLVNLFKSMPYNVGYTVVGSPTIANGVVSGFSDNNYLTINNSFSQTSDIDVILRITTGNNVTTNQYPFAWRSNVSGTARNCGIYLNQGGKYGVIFRDTEDTSLQYATATAVLSENTSCYIRMKYTKSDKSLKLGHSTDGTNYVYAIEETLTNDFAPMTSNIRFGRGIPSEFPFLGSIDFNNNRTSIGINNITWFRGTAAMTKTCAIVGCVGTADLTQTDKDIALNKGWSLTLS